jgi:hypothetical protein
VDCPLSTLSGHLLAEYGGAADTGKSVIYVAWWTGRGYSTILIVVASIVLLQLLRMVLGLPNGLWVFDVAMLGAAAANWTIGRKLNRKALLKVRSNRARERLFYRARHKFMSLPMQTFSVMIAAVGMAVLAAADMHPSVMSAIHPSRALRRGSLSAYCG